MKTKPFFWIVLAILGLTAGWLWLKPPGPRQRQRAQRLHSVNSIYLVTVTAEITNAPAKVR